MTGLLKPLKTICAKRLFSSSPKATWRKRVKTPDFRGFFLYPEKRFSPERAVILAKSQQFKGVSLWLS